MFPSLSLQRFRNTQIWMYLVDKISIDWNLYSFRLLEERTQHLPNHTLEKILYDKMRRNKYNPKRDLVPAKLQIKSNAMQWRWHPLLRKDIYPMFFKYSAGATEPSFNTLRTFVVIIRKIRSAQKRKDWKIPGILSLIDRIDHTNKGLGRATNSDSSSLENNF